MCRKIWRFWEAFEMRRFLGMCVTPSRLVQQPSEDELVCQVGLELLDVRMPWVWSFFKGKKLTTVAMFQPPINWCNSACDSFWGIFFSCALFAAVPEQHTVWIRPDCHPVLRVLFGQRQLFEVSAGGQAVFVSPDTRDGTFAPGQSQELKTWTNFLQEARVGVAESQICEVITVCLCLLYGMALWCIMMHPYCTLWCITMMYYDSLWFIAIDYDSLWFISWWFFFAVLPKIYRYIGWVVLLPSMPVTTRIIIYFSNFSR